MAKAEEFISPANLWGKPLPGSMSTAPKKKKEEKATPMRTKDADEYEDDELTEATGNIQEHAILDEEDDEAAYSAAADLEGSDEAEEDDDETEYEPEEGDDVVADDQSEVVSTVEDDEDAEPPVSAKKTSGTKKKVTNMVDKKSGADHIREEISRRKASGESVRGVDIVAALTKRRVVVSPAQVSQLLKKAGVGQGKRGVAVAAGETRSRDAARNKHAKAEPTKVAPKRPVAVAPSKTSTLPMGQLKAASAFLDACEGCYDTAGEILTAHKQLGAMMSR